MEEEIEMMLKSITRRVDETLLGMALSGIQEAWARASEGSEVEARLAKARDLLEGKIA